jgi:hypothetical protein
MKNLVWLADSRTNVKSFPAGVQDDFGYALYAAQLGETIQKPGRCTHGLGSGVMEIKANERKAEPGVPYIPSPLATPSMLSMPFRRNLRRGLLRPCPK